jgi:hypothetical protein
MTFNSASTLVMQALGLKLAHAYVSWLLRSMPIGTLSIVLQAWVVLTYDLVTWSMVIMRSNIVNGFEESMVVYCSFKLQA